MQATELPHVIGVPGPPAQPWEVLPPQVIVIVVIASLAAAALVLWPIVGAIARRIEGRGRIDATMQDEIDQLGSRVRELELHESRVLELEEREDFAERMLAQRSAAWPSSCAPMRRETAR